MKKPSPDTVDVSAENAAAVASIMRDVQTLDLQAQVKREQLRNRVLQLQIEMGLGLEYEFAYTVLQFVKKK